MFSYIVGKRTITAIAVVAGRLSTHVGLAGHMARQAYVRIPATFPVPLLLQLTKEEVRCERTRHKVHVPLRDTFAAFCIVPDSVRNSILRRKKRYEV